MYNGNSANGKSNFVQQYKPNTGNLLGTGGWTGSDGQVKYGILGRSPFGRADGKIIYEHKIRGTSFSSLSNTSGSGSGISYLDFGLNGSIVNANASGLNTNKEYTWRARVQYSPVNNPYQKLGPWRFYNSQFPLPYEGYKPKSVPVIPLTPAAALNFDGTNDYVALPDALTSTITGGNSFTIEYWFKSSDTKSTVHLQNSNGYIISGYQGMFIISSDGGVEDGISLGNATDGQWHHIAVTRERNKVNGFRSYLDGFPVDQRNSADVNLPVITSGGKLGGDTDSASYMNGTLNKLRFWDRAITEDEVGYRSYCELQGVSFGLKAKYNFNQGFSNHNNSGEATLYDSSGNSYNGLLSNFALQGISSNWTEPGLVSSGFDCYPGLTLNLKIIPQGFFNINGQLNMRDTMKVYLHSSVSPYNAVDSAISVVDSITYEGIFNFVNSVNGN